MIGYNEITGAHAVLHRKLSLFLIFDMTEGTIRLSLGQRIICGRHWVRHWRNVHSSGKCVPQAQNNESGSPRSYDVG
jgi:hypothetical protein